MRGLLRMGAAVVVASAASMGMKIEPIPDRRREDDNRREPAATRYGRSRYMPHIGAKEAARHAGKPDGKMHLTPHEDWAARRARWAY